jgi:hypothetical protein
MRLSCVTCSAASTDFGADFSYRHERQICSGLPQIGRRQAAMTKRVSREIEQSRV